MDTQAIIRLAVGLYVLATLVVFFRLVAGKIAFVRHGHPESRADHIGRRIAIFFIEVLGQTKVRRRLTAGWAHAMIFWGFLAFAISTLNLLDRLAVGGQGFLVGPLDWFDIVVDVFAALIILGCVVLAVRRYVVKPTYLTYHSHESGIVLAAIAVIAVTHLGERYLAGTTSTYFGYAHLAVAFTFLAYVPPAVLSAIIFPELFMPGGTLNITFGNLRLISGIVAALVAWRTRNALLTIVVGMVTLFVLQALF